MSYKTELHCHGGIVSACADISPEETVRYYLENGYSTLVLTDHLSPATFDPKHYSGGRSWREMIDYFLSGYRAVREAANGRLNVLLGAEVRIDLHSGSDFLVYGPDEQTLYDLHDLLDDDLPTLSRRVREAGCLFMQAHPFRNNMKITNPTLLDGLEVFNGNPSHDSRNDFAAAWAKRFDLIPVSGSDLHHARLPIGAGIETEDEIKTNEQLLEILRSRQYSLLHF